MLELVDEGDGRVREEVGFTKFETFLDTGDRHALVISLADCQQIALAPFELLVGSAGLLPLFKGMKENRVTR